MSELKKQIDIYRKYAKGIIDGLDKSNKPDDIQTKNVIINQQLELEGLLHGIYANDDLIIDFINPRQASLNRPIQNVKFFDDKIKSNLAQKIAVEKLLSMKNLLLIQGPPGTGKTSVITEMIRQILHRDPRAKIMITSSAHVAVNNVIDKLVENNIKNLARIKNKDEADEIYKEMDIDFILDDFKESIANKHDSFKSSVYKLLDENASLLAHSVIMTKNVIGVTINSIHGCHFRYEDQFDYVFVDEVGKSNLLELLSVVSHAKKLILIGDPKQLPPGIEENKNFWGLSKEEYDYIRYYPYINYLFDNINPSCKCFLNSQFRMVQPIGSYISESYYDNQLNNGKKDLDKNALNIITYQVTDANKVEEIPLVNQTEIDILIEKLKDIPKDKSIAVISFYKDQVSLLRKKVKNTGFAKIEIDTVDAFQGKDADIVFLLSVRNKGKVTSFIEKPNRLNVAISRAKQQMWLIGNIAYLSKVEHLRKYISFSKNYNGTNYFCNKYFYNGSKIVPYIRPSHNNNKNFKHK